MRGTTLFATIFVSLSNILLYTIYNWQHLYIEQLGILTKQPSLKMFSIRYIQGKY